MFYAPFDEDYGYVTVEAFMSRRPVLTTGDSGGVLEFVVDGVNGFVCPPGAHREMGSRIDRLAGRSAGWRAASARPARRRSRGFDWDSVVERLLAPLN